MIILLWLWLWLFITNIRTKHVRCNPDAAPRLTSGGYEDKVHAITPINILFIGGGEFWSLMKKKNDVSYYPNQDIVQRGWQILIPYEDKVDVFTQINILFILGGEFWSLMKIKLMLLPNQHIVHRGWRILTPHEDKVDVITPVNILFRGGGEF